MSQWVINGIRRGIKTIAYPGSPERAAGVTPGLPQGCEMDGAGAAIVERCPTEALTQTNGGVSVDHRRCVHCYRCVREVERPLDWQQTYEWAALQKNHDEFGAAFARSIHIIVVDAGDCGACLNEVKQLKQSLLQHASAGIFHYTHATSR